MPSLLQQNCCSTPANKGSFKPNKRDPAHHLRRVSFVPPMHVIGEWLDYLLKSSEHLSVPRYRAFKRSSHLQRLCFACPPEKNMVQYHSQIKPNKKQYARRRKECCVMRAFFRKNAHIVSLLPVLTLMLMIFYFSAQPAAQSDRTSGGIVELLLRLLYPSFAGLEASRQHTLASAVAHIVRKCAHFGEYAALGMALLWHLRAWQIRHSR